MSAGAPAVRRAQRLVLWDLDGTLVHDGGIGAAAFDLALAEVLGQGPGQRLQMSGKTDTQIVREHLALMGAHHDAVPSVLAALERQLASARERLTLEGRVAPGAPALLEALDRQPGVVQSVLTGNVAANAVIKASAFGLDRFLDLEAGAFGSDHADRCELVPVALERQRLLRGRAFTPEATWVVGDTPNDLACARAGGARCLLVASGRFGLDELSTLGADAVCADLTDTASIAALLCTGL